MPTDPRLSLAYQRQHAGEVLTEGPDAPPPSGFLADLNRSLMGAAYPQSAGDFASLLIPNGISTAMSAGGAALRRVGRQKIAPAVAREAPEYSTDVDLMGRGGFAPQHGSASPRRPMKRFGAPADTPQVSDAQLDDLVRHFGGTQGPTVRVPVPSLAREELLAQLANR